MQLRWLLFLLLLSFNSSAQHYFLFIGTYTDSGSKGVYVYRFNATTGKVNWVSNTDSAKNPSYLAIAPNGKYIYAVNETHGDQPGGVSAFSFDRNRGTLSFINQQPSGGDDPCYVSETRNSKWIFVANYSGGSLSAFSVNEDGSLQPGAQNIQHSGSSVNKDRQEKAHVHSVVLSPAQDYLFSPDLGMDQIAIYKIDATATQPLQPADPPFVATEPGSGPRHFTFHPNKKFAYVIEELSGAVVAYKYYNGHLSFEQRIAAHPADFKGVIGSADIHISPDGKFLYASNRGDENTITIFAINPKTGKLALKGYQSTLGATPRNFTIDPTGHYLLVANQNTNNIVVFKRNIQTGLLHPTGVQIKVSRPVCLQMMKSPA